MHCPVDIPQHWREALIGSFPRDTDWGVYGNDGNRLNMTGYWNTQKILRSTVEFNFTARTAHLQKVMRPANDCPYHGMAVLHLQQLVQLLARDAPELEIDTITVTTAYERGGYVWAPMFRLNLQKTSLELLDAMFFHRITTLSPLMQEGDLAVLERVRETLGEDDCALHKIIDLKAVIPQKSVIKRAFQAFAGKGAGNSMLETMRGHYGGVVPLEAYMLEHTRWEGVFNVHNGYDKARLDADVARTAPTRQLGAHLKKRLG